MIEVLLCGLKTTIHVTTRRKNVCDRIEVATDLSFRTGMYIHETRYQKEKKCRVGTWYYVSCECEFVVKCAGTGFKAN